MKVQRAGFYGLMSVLVGSLFVPGQARAGIIVLPETGCGVSGTENLRFKVWTDKPVYVTGEQIIAHLQISNVGKADATFAISEWDRNSSYIDFGWEANTGFRALSSITGFGSIRPGQTYTQTQVWTGPWVPPPAILAPPGQYYAFGGLKGVGAAQAAFQIVLPAADQPNVRSELSDAAPVKLTLETDKAVYLPGEDVHVKLSVTNTSESRQSFEKLIESYYGYDWQISPWFHVDQRTGPGEHSRVSQSRGATFDSLDPGQTQQWETTWDQSEDLHAALKREAQRGTYDITANLGPLGEISVPIWTTYAGPQDLPRPRQQVFGVNFGGSSSTTAVAAVPEPSTLVLGLVGVMLLARRRRSGV